EAVGDRVQSIDLEWFGGRPGNVRADYAAVPAAEVQRHDAVLLLAGMSSPVMAADYPSAFRNNVCNFAMLLGKISRDQRSVYAASVSVYSGCTERHEHFEACRLASPASFKGPYDLTKAVVDDLAIESGLDVCGLRFASVCGASPNTRSDILVNQMAI